MEFRILGPLEVVSGTGLVEVGRAKLRALLALLLVHANQVVAPDRLIEDLWEASPPESATGTLQTYVSQLRKALHLESLRTRPGGYVLEVQPAELDALRFELALQEVAEADDAAPQWVASRLGEALAWWRGSALADFEGVLWAQPEAARLEELRLGAIEDRVEARLRLGEHAALVPELESLVARHPLRERQWAQLMRVLYRCDRQAEALRAYGQLRRHLGKELGIAPSKELARLEQAILLQEPGLDWQEPPPGNLTMATLRSGGVTLPNPPTTFVGRRVEVEAVGRLTDGHRLVTLTGVGGCGKTRLAIEAACRLASDFPDGVRFADLAAVTDEDQVPAAVVNALGLADDPTGTDPTLRLATYLADRAVLCVLDNCEHLLDACAALAEAITLRPGASRLLATSREPLGVVGEQIYAVPSLDADTEAVLLFADRAGEARAGFAVDDGNRASIAEICRRLDGIPLAIELAAARVAHLSPAQVLERLDDRFRFLTGARRVQRHQTLTATLDWSHDLLEPAERVVLRRLSTFPASFSLEAADAVADVGDVVEPLGSLVAKSLVQVVDGGERLRYRLLETVRFYAQAKLDAAGETEACRARLCVWVLTWLASIPLEERWFGDADLLAAEHPSVRAALEWSLTEGQAEVVARIAAGIDWARREHWRDGIRWCERAAANADTLPSELQAQLYVVLWQLGRMRVREAADWAPRDDWAQRAIDASRGEPSPLHAYALVVRAMGLAIRASEVRDESLARQSTDWAEASVAMSEQFPAPWHMYCRLSAGGIYTTQALWLGDAEPAERHYAAGIAAAPPGQPYLGLRATLCGALALRRLVDGDASGALALARDAQVDVAVLPVVGREDPLALVLVVALGATGDVDAALRELRAYDDAVRRADWGLGRETVVLYGGVLAALREDWETAARMLAAGERSRYRAAATALLYVTFGERVQAALGVELFTRLSDEGRAMPLADALAAALR